MKVDHRIKIKILGGIDTDSNAGIQIKESGTLSAQPNKRNPIMKRVSIFSKKDEGAEESQLAAPTQRRLSVFQDRLSVFKGASPTSLSSQRSPVSPKLSGEIPDIELPQTITRPSSVVEKNCINIVSSVSLKKEHIGNEFEFFLNESFHSVFIYVYRKKLGITQLLANLELPAIVFEPDEMWHEQIFALKDETYTDKQGHQFTIFSVQNPVPCYHCSIIMQSNPIIPELDFFKCETCGIICHEKCHPSILSTCSKVLSFRISYCYTKEPILESSKYQTLRDGFFDVNHGLLNLFARVCDNLDEASFHILKVLETFPKRKAIDVILDLCTNEMAQIDNYHSIFQEPSLAIKVLELFMKHVAKDFLKFTLERSIAQIINDDFDCELDSRRFANEKKSPHITEKLSNLENYLEQIFRAITTSPKSCPFTLRCILSKIYGNANKLYPQQPSAGYVVSNNILFRKFFIPALIVPENYGISVKGCRSNAQRTLTILCKMLQRIANLDFFDSNADLNFQKLNRLIGSYHPIISIYINELTKVSMVPDEPILKIDDVQVVEKDSKTTKIPWYKILFSFCFPTKSLAKSLSDLDLFKEKHEQNVDWENLDAPFEESLSKNIDADLHIAALGRLLLRYGDKLILICQNDKETNLAYDGLGWASSLRSKQRQQMEDFRKATLLRIQQDYLMQFYTEHDEVLMNSQNFDTNADKNETVPDQQQSSFQSGKTREKSESSSLSSQSSGKYTENIFKSSALSVDSVQCETRGENCTSHQEERLETPTIGVSIQEESRDSPKNESINMEEHISEDEYIPEDEVIQNGLAEKRKSLMLNLDSILRPKEVKDQPLKMDSPELQFEDNQKDISKLIPRNKAMKEEETVVSPKLL